MADKSISELPQALQISNDDLFVLQQNGEARKMLGATLLEFLTLNVISVTVTTLPADSAATATFNKTTGVLALGIPKGDKGAIGEPGAKGDPGATGAANVLSIGTVTSGDAASVSITGEAPNQVLNFVLQKGDKGEKGNTGPANTLSIGSVTSGDTPSASMTGIAPNQELNLVLPKGDPGTAAPTITSITVRQSDYHLIVTLSNGTSYDAGYCRGASGSGTGDMQAETYDPQGKNQDIFAYVDNKINEIPTPDLSSKLDKTGDGSNVTVSFTPPSATAKRVNLTSGEKLSAALAKVYQWFANLGTLAFQSSVEKSDLASDVQASLGKADSALQSAPVTSVNGQTGAVQISVPAAVSPSDAVPQAPAESGSPGSAVTYARGDHKHPKEVFWVTIDSTPYTTVKTAHDAGKLIIGINTIGNAIFQLVNVRDTFFTFSVLWANNCSDNVIAEIWTIDNNNVWRSKECSIEPEIEKLKTSLYKVTLSSSGWDGTTKQQAVTVSGILADTTKQEIIVAPVDTSYNSAWNSCGVLCVAQAANSLTFQCGTVPTVDIEVYVTVRSANYQS